MPFISVEPKENELGRFENASQQCCIRVFKDTGHGRLGIHDDRYEPHAWITSRSTQRYFEFFSNQSLDKESGPQFVELGAGLGGFIPDLVRCQESLLPPIVIDPIDYTWVRTQLTELLSLSEVQCLGEQVRRDVEELLCRCDAYMSPRVRHLQMPLRQAFQKHRDELIGIGDAVLDLYGATTYEENESFDDIPSVVNALRLLSEQGRFYSSFPVAQGVLMDWRKNKDHYLQLAVQKDAAIRSTCDPKGSQ
jgi:hypothetical protein